MGLAEKVERFISAQAARDDAERDVVKEMEAMGIERAMVPNLRAVVRLADAGTDDASAWVETDVVLSG